MIGGGNEEGSGEGVAKKEGANNGGFAGGAPCARFSARSELPQTPQPTVPRGMRTRAASERRVHRAGSGSESERGEEIPNGDSHGGRSPPPSRAGSTAACPGSCAGTPSRSTGRSPCEWEAMTAVGGRKGRVRVGRGRMDGGNAAPAVAPGHLQAPLQALRGGVLPPRVP